MKKSFKIGALALAMSALLFSCADPNNSNADQNPNKDNTSIDVNEIEGYTPSKTAVAVNAENLSDAMNSMVYDNSIFMEAFYNLCWDENNKPTAFKTEVIDTLTEEKTIKNPDDSTSNITTLKDPANLDLKNKTYTGDGIELIINKGGFNYKSTQHTENTGLIYEADADIDSSLKIDGTKFKVIEESGEEADVTETTRDSYIKAVKGQVKVLGNGKVELANAEELPKSITGKIETAILKATMLFDTGKYNGFINASVDIKVEDAAKTYEVLKNITEEEKTAITKVLNYAIPSDTTNQKPEKPSDTDITTVKTFVGKIPASVKANITFTDINGGSPFEMVKIENLSNFAELIINAILSANNQ